jgi:hypothetical protein
LVHCFFFQFEKLENLVELLEEQPKGTGRYHCMCVCLIFFVPFFLYLEPGRATHMFTHPEREREREFIFTYFKLKPTHRVNIKPHNMACVSPRVFWNIVRHCQVFMFFFYSSLLSCFILHLAFYFISRVSFGTLCVTARFLML